MCCDTSIANFIDHVVVYLPNQEVIYHAINSIRFSDVWKHTQLNMHDKSSYFNRGYFFEEHPVYSKIAVCEQ